MLHTIAPAAGSRKKRMRKGRGNGSKGTTAGRGTKGQGSRSGKGKNFGFEGGQMPLLFRQPKFGGFKNPNRIEHEVLNIGDLEEKLDAGSYDTAALRDKMLLRTKRPVKLLGRGEMKKKFTLTVDKASKAAVAAVEKAGGSVTLTK